MTNTLAQSMYSLPHFFTNFAVFDLADILIVSLLVYFILLFVKQTKSYFIVNLVLFLVVLFYVSKTFDLSLTRQLLQPVLTFFFVIFVVVFQGEFRRFIRWIGSQSQFAFERRVPIPMESLSAVCVSVEQMARERVGAIIVFQGEQQMEDVLDGGFGLDGRISKQLILSIFDPHTPGHDGAIVINKNRVKKFGVQLPLAEKFNDFANVGTRHRASVGITEVSDCLAVVVSEERGEISVAENGKLQKVENIEELRKILLRFLKENEDETQPVKGFWHYFILDNFITKISSVLIAVVLWTIFVYQAGISTKDIVVPVEFKFVPQGLILEDTGAQEITITVEGLKNDLDKLSLKDIGASVNATNVQAGKNKIELTKEDIVVPSYIKVRKIFPVWFNAFFKQDN